LHRRAGLPWLVDGRLLLERSRILLAVEGRSLPVPAGLTVQQALRRLAVPPSAGDLLAVDHTVLRSGVYPPRVLVNGQPAAGIRRLRRGDRLTVEPGRDRIGPVVRGLQQLPARRPGSNPVRWLSTGSAQAVLNRGSLSGRVVPVGFHPAGGSPAAPLPVALTFDDGPWPHTTGQILAILAQRQARLPSLSSAARSSVTPSWSGGSSRPGGRAAAIPTTTTSRSIDFRWTLAR
jgi:hypothetical protein